MSTPTAQDLNTTARLFDSPASNRLLSLLLPEVLERLLPHLERVSMDRNDVVYDPDKLIHHIYFPLNSVFSLVNILEDGEVVEFGTIGNEGFVGFPVVMGAESVPSKAFCQVPGNALRMRAEVLREEFQRGGPLQALLLRHVLSFFNQVAQTASCNRFHPLEERCSRWLLMTHDRVGRDEFPLTQEFLAAMLGVRRATVTLAMGILKEAGLIHYKRGVVRIIDREDLEDLSCECYRKIRRNYDRLFPQ